MAIFEVKVPQLSESVAEATLSLPAQGRVCRDEKVSSPRGGSVVSGRAAKPRCLVLYSAQHFRKHERGNANGLCWSSRLRLAGGWLCPPPSRTTKVADQ